MNQETKIVNILAAVCLIITAVAVALHILAPIEAIFWAIVALVLAVLAKS